MKNFKFSKKLSRILSTMMIFVVGFVYCSGFTAFAAIDLDVTIVPPEDTVTNNQRFEVDLQIVTKSTNGYVELVIDIEYDADILALAAPVNQDGYRVSGSKGQLTLTYYDPTGTNTPTEISNEVLIPIEFIVLESAPDTTTKIKATIHHAYNNKGKNITWTPIYDKEIEIIRINDGTTVSSDVSSEEVSSEFVVGQNAGTVSRTSSIASNGGKIASIVLGAIVVFVAGVVVGYIICMRKYEKGGSPSPKDYTGGDYDYDDYDDYYDDYGDDDYVGKSSIDSSSGQNNYSSSLYPDDDNDDGYYRRAEDEYSVADEDDYFSPASTERGTSGNYLDAFNSSIAPRSIEPVDFGSMVTSSDVTGSDTDDDDYPILFMTRDSNPKKRSSNSSSASSRQPSFDEQVETLFGKYSDNVNRNVDDGYGGSFSSSSNRSTRSDRSRRNR